MEEADKKRFWDKVKESPFVPVGILGTFGMIGYGVYDFKNRGSMSASVYIMQYRVKAQSVIVGAMAIGVTVSVIKDLLFKKKENPVD